MASRRSARRKPSSATTRISLGSISIRQPVRIGRLSSSAMAKIVLPIMSRSTLCGTLKASPGTCGSSGYSTGSKPMMVVRKVAQRMVACILSLMVISHRPPGSLRTTSHSSLPGSTARPSSVNVAGITVSMPSARSVQVRRRPVSHVSKRMPSRIGLGERAASARLTMVRLAFRSLVSQEKRISSTSMELLQYIRISRSSRSAVETGDKCPKIQNRPAFWPVDNPCRRGKALGNLSTRVWINRRHARAWARHGINRQIRTYSLFALFPGNPAVR